MTESPVTSRHEESVWRPTGVHQTLALIGSIVLCFVAAGIGASATMTSVSGWYRTIAKPSWNPPDWIFGPVWTILYFLMAVAAWLVWRRSGWRGAGKPLVWFVVQLGLNVCWSAIFFGMQLPGAAFAEIFFLWLAIVMTIIAFRSHSRPAAALMMPYFAWTSFAAVLNGTIWWLNL